MLSFILLVPALIQAQTDKKEVELKKLEAGIVAAKAKVALNERKLAVADSLITVGTKMIADSKTETKVIDGEAKKLDKEYASKQKQLTKLTTSKDKEEATKARADLKALNTQYRADTKALTTRLTSATKKATTGNANITKGKTAKANLKDPMKLSKATLDAAQKKYDVATGTNEKSTKDKKKK
jgi:hypothetical protein